MNKKEEDYNDDGDGFILSINDKGEAELNKPEDYATIKLENMGLIKGFIDENKKLFEEYCKKLKMKNKKMKIRQQHNIIIELIMLGMIWNTLLAILNIAFGIVV